MNADPGRTLTLAQQVHNSARKGAGGCIACMHSKLPTLPLHQQGTVVPHASCGWRPPGATGAPSQVCPIAAPPLDADPTPAGQGRSAGHRWLCGWRPAAATLTLTRALTLPQQGEDTAQVSDACAASGRLVLQECFLRARRRCAQHGDTLDTRNRLLADMAHLAKGV